MSTITTFDQIPNTDKEAWNLYPKYRWLYNTSQLLDYQKVDWSPFPTTEHLSFINNFNIDREIVCENVVESDTQPNDGHIYINHTAGNRLTTTAVVVKGDVKWLTMHETDGGELTSPVGDIELRISALTILHLQKFAGIITVDTVGNTIISVRLRALPEYADMYGDEWKKKVVRLYNKKQWSTK